MAILIHFINDVFRLETACRISVNFLYPIQNPDIACTKESIVGVLCSEVQGRKHIVEIQVASHKVGFAKSAQ